MKIIEAIVLGIVQGFTEFIPVSSSGHLVLLSAILDIKSNGITFEIILHVATLFSILFIFKHEIYEMARKPFSRTNLLLAAATIPTAIIYVLFKKFFLDMFETSDYLGVWFILTGLILFFAETGKKDRGTGKDIAGMSYTDAIFIGTIQGMAIIPGISRSGTTLAAGLFRKADRNSALRFSFLLSIPAILGGLLIDVIDIYKGEATFDLDVLPLISGSIAAFICGYIAIRYMVKFIAKNGVRPFSYYLWTLGVLVLLDRYVFNIFL